MYRIISSLFVSALFIIMMGCSGDPTEKKVDSLPLTESIDVEQKSIKGELHELQIGKSITLMEGQNIVLEERENYGVILPELYFEDFYQELSEELDSSSKDYFDSLMSLDADVQIAYEQALSEHPYGETTFTISKTSQARFSAVAEKESMLRMLEYSNPYEDLEMKVTDMDLSEEPLFKEKFDFYIKVESTYPEIGNHKNYLIGKDYISHTFVKVEDEATYKVDVSYTVGTSEEVQKNLMLMASSYE